MRLLAGLCLLLELASSLSSSSFSEHLSIRPLRHGSLLLDFSFHMQYDLRRRCVRDKTSSSSSCVAQNRDAPLVLADLYTSLPFTVGHIQLASTRGKWRMDEWGHPLTSSKSNYTDTLYYPNDYPEGLSAYISQYSPQSNQTTIRDTWNLLTAAMCTSQSSHRGATKIYPSDSFGTNCDNGTSALTWAVQSALKLPCIDELNCIAQLLPCHKESPLARSLNMHWLVNAPYYSVLINLNKNIDMMDSTNRNSGQQCVDFTDKNGMLYEDCRVRTFTDVTLSFVLTSTDSLDDELSTKKYNENVNMSRNGYSIFILNSLRSALCENSNLPLEYLLNYIDSSSLLRVGHDTSNDVTTIESDATSVRSCRGRAMCSVGFSLSYYANRTLGDTSVTSTGYALLDIAKRVIDNKVLDVYSEMKATNHHTALSAEIRVYEPTYLDGFEGNFLRPELHSFQYNLFSSEGSENVNSCQFNFSGKSTTRGSVLNIPGSMFLPSENDPIVLYFQLVLPPQCTIVVSLPFNKRFLKREFIPTDASRGMHVSSGAVHWRWQNESIWHSHFPPQFLVTVPFPDASMPFNVITIVSTLLALLLGSMMNVLVRKSSLKKEEINSEGKLSRFLKLFSS